MRVHALCLEDGNGLLNLVEHEAVQVEVGVVDSLVRDGDGASHTLGESLHVGEVQTLLGDGVNLACNANLGIVDAVGPYLVAYYAGEHGQVGRQFQSLNLGVDELLDVQGDHVTSGQVAGGVLVGTSGHGVGKDGGGVLALLLDSLEELTQLG